MPPRKPGVHRGEPRLNAIRAARLDLIFESRAPVTFLQETGSWLMMILDFLFQIWRRFTGPLQWWTLWLVSSKFMISVSGVIFDPEGKILLQRHRHWVADVWGLPGGIVCSGESLEEAFAREVSEETGLRIRDIELVRLKSGYKLRVEAYFRASLADGGQPMKLQKQEVIEARFFARDCLPENLLPAQRAFIENLD